MGWPFFVSSGGSGLVRGPRTFVVVGRSWRFAEQNLRLALPSDLIPPSVF
jgi:hypothetical protein